MGRASQRRVAHRPPSDAPFYAALLVIGGTYVLLIIAMLVADLSFTTPDHILAALRDDDIQYAVKLSLASCTASACLSLVVAIPIGYLMSRSQFRGKGLLDAILDIPIVLPPLVIGLSLLILFRTAPARALDDWLGFTYAIPGVVLAQFMVAGAFAVRTMRTTFDQLNPRAEQVALTLGCSARQAFWLVALPAAWPGALAAFTLAWARSLGEFGPILIFCGATRQHTEVMSTTVFLELSIGNIEMAVAVSVLMVLAAVAVLVVVRLGGRSSILGGAAR